MPNPKSLWANAIYENNMNENLSRQEDAIQKDMRFTDEMKQSLLKVLSKMKILSVIVCIVSIPITLIAIIICFDGITKGNLASLTSIISLAVQWYCIYCSFTIISLGRLACHDDNETAMVTMFETWEKSINIALYALALVAAIGSLSIITSLLKYA